MSGYHNFDQTASNLVRRAHPLSLWFSPVLMFLALIPSGVRVAVAQTACSNTETPQQIDDRIDSLIEKMTIAERVAQLQDRAPAIPRLGVPAYNWWSEGLHGFARDGYATVFPQAIGLAATWDPALMREVGDAVSTEARAKFNSHGNGTTPRFGGLTVWSPNVNIFRDPRWGRGQETYGEDPFLTATMGIQFVEGMQGGDPFYLKADATPKHFVVHSGPEKGRDGFNAVVSQHDLADTYLPAFHALITTGHAAAMMCSYNAINGTPSCANAGTLDDLVRKQWQFAGYVVSDCDAVGNLTSYQHYTKNAAQGAAAALNAGVDLDCGTTYAALTQSYEQNLITEAALNRAVHRLMLARVHLGTLDAPGCTPWDRISTAELDSPQHRALALRAAEESIVLLRNDDMLPLNPTTSRVAVIGPTADSIKVLEASYHGTAANPVTSLDGIRSIFREVHYAQGSVLVDGMTVPVERTALRTGPDPGAAPGLTAEYFNAPSFDGAPVVKTTVEKIDLDLDRVGPAPEITTKRYAARWSGYLVPPAAGDYTLRVNMERCWDCKSHDRFRLTIDQHTVVENHDGGSSPDRVVLHFADTSPHALELELIHTGDDEGIALEWEPPASALLDQAIATARQSDVIVASVGLSADLEGEALQLHADGFEGGDRTRLDLPAPQRVLLSRLQELHKPMVVALTSGSAVVPNIDSAALLEAWYPGEEGGRALAMVLSGAVNPSGRLPVTFYRSVADLPAFTDYGMIHRTYRYYDGPVLFPFGFGLSYSRFRYSEARLSSGTVAAGQPLTVKVNVENASQVGGSDVAELYIEPPRVPGAPRLALRGFQRVALEPGERRDITFTLRPEQMSFDSADGEQVIRAGTYHLFVGSTEPRVGVDRGLPFRIVGTSLIARPPLGANP